MGSIFQSIINNAPNLVFDTMKPFMLKEVDTKLRTEIDSKMKDLMGDRSFPNSITPLDMAIGEARRSVREMGYDPLILGNYNHSAGLFSVHLTNTWVNGVSGFYRVGDLNLSLDNNTVTIGNMKSLNESCEVFKKRKFSSFIELNLGTQEIMGSTNWEVTASKGIITRTGLVRFFVQYIQAKVVVSQTLDTRNPPQMNDLQFELGNIQVNLIYLIIFSICYTMYYLLYI